MIGRIASLGALVVSGIIVADILTHPAGTQAASSGITSILTPTYSALLGGGSKGGTGAAT